MGIFNKKKSNNVTPKKYFNWCLTFTKRVILLVTIVWAIAMIYSAAMITVAIFMTGNFSYLDTYITEMSSTFWKVVGINIVSKTIENLSKYNDWMFGKSIKPNNENTINSELTDMDFSCQDEDQNMI